MPAGYAVSEAARQAGLTVHQVRTYVNVGLMKPCATTPAGYFLFGEDCVTRLRLIGAATRAGLYLREIADLVRALDGDDRQALNAARRSVLVAISARQAAILRLQELVSGACGAAATKAIA
jgi:MerR family mercuric resistance operon transcriptional regulator